MKPRKAMFWLLGCCALLACSAWADGGPWIPQKATARVIVDNDFAGDPDGLAALAHQLLSPKTETVLVVSTQLNPKFSHRGDVDTALLGIQLAEETQQRLNLSSTVTVTAEPYKGERVDEAVEAIYQEAMKTDTRPMFYTCGGPLTVLAAALKKYPEIAEKITVIWIGGGPYPNGGWEYNLATDYAAAKAVLENPAITLWQVPQDTYRQVQFSVAEMATNWRSISPFGRWLYDRFTSPPDFVELGGTWPMGDHPLVLLTALSLESSRYKDIPAQTITPDFKYGKTLPNRTVRVFQQVDSRLLLGDFAAQMQLHHMNNSL